MSKIEWTDRTWNVITGCDKVSKECNFCYAERIANMNIDNPKSYWYKRAFTDVIFYKDRLEEPLHWRKKSMFFLCSMSDIMHQSITDDQIASIFDVMERSPRHTFALLTKRPRRLADLTLRVDPETGLFAMPIPDNVWVGVSIENTDSCWRAWELSRVVANTTFISFQPLLESLARAFPRHRELSEVDWVIIGGETGNNARLCKTEWIVYSKGVRICPF